MPMDTITRAKVSHELRKLGFGALDDPNLVPQIAFCIRSHEHFRGMLMGVVKEQREFAYRALAPHLRFTPKPLDVYEREIQEKAEREQWDIWDGTAYPKPFKVGEIESDEHRLARLAEEAIEQAEHEKAKGVLEMVCTKCTVQALFPAPKRKLAVKAAHEAGWRWTEINGTRKQWCPKHVPARATMKLTCSNCPIIQRIRVWDEQDGYRDARRLGWQFDDAKCLCPECGAKAVVVQ